MYNKENLAGLKRMGSLAPVVMKAFLAFDKAGATDAEMVEAALVAAAPRAGAAVTHTTHALPNSPNAA